jgi:tetracycline repressor-like protein
VSGTVSVNLRSESATLLRCSYSLAAKIGEPGVGSALAGVFSDAVNDPALREILASGLQAPYRLALQDALGESEHRVRLLMDVVTGTLIHRMGMTGEPMVDADVAVLVEMVLRTHFADLADTAWTCRRRRDQRAPRRDALRSLPGARKTSHPADRSAASSRLTIEQRVSVNVG